MNNITKKRLFGSNFPEEVKKTLEERQLIAKEPQPGDSLTQTKGLHSFKQGD